jgi:hypothetical protein
MQAEIMEEMSSWLKSAVSNILDKATTHSSSSKHSYDIVQEYHQTHILLTLFINTKVLNSYVLYASQKTRHEDPEILKNLKRLMLKLKDLSHIHTRCTHMKGKTTSKELSYLHKSDLKANVRRLESIRDALDDEVIGYFNNFEKELFSEINPQKGKGIPSLPHCFEFLLTLLHKQYFWNKVKIEEGKEGKIWPNPYSEISRWWMFSFEVTCLPDQQVQFDLPLVFCINEISSKKLPHVIQREIRRYAYTRMGEQGVEGGTDNNFKIKVVNQPEVFWVTIGEQVDKIEFWNAMEENSIVPSDLFDLMDECKFVKTYYPKHAVFWNTKYGIYEVFTLQTFKYLDERGVEKVEGMWIGEYNKKSQQVHYTDLFENVKTWNIEPILILWERFSLYNAELAESLEVGKRKYTLTQISENPDKYK